MTADEVDNFEQQSFLIADCGHTNTTVALFDVVAGSFRLIAQTAVPTTAADPWFDISVGVKRAIQKISRITGRQLLYESGSLIYPERVDGTGVDKFTAVVSAAPPLQTLLVGLFEDVSLASARRAMRGTYSQETETFNLADNLSEQEHAAVLLKNRPELIFIVGGTDHGADKRLLRLVESVDIGLEMVEAGRRPQILYAGNAALQEQVTTLLGENNQVHTAANVRPSLKQEQTAVAAQVMDKLYGELKIRKVPGIRSLFDWSDETVAPTAQAFANIIRVMATTQGGRVLGVDLGSDSLTITTADPQTSHLSVRTDLGMGRPIANLLHTIDVDAVARWLSIEMAPADIKNFIANKSLFPQTIPATEKELHLEQAIVRELLRCAAQQTMADLNWSALPNLKTIVGRGRALTNVSRLGQAALMLLDALQPTGIFSLVLDQYGLLAGLGAAATHNPLLPVQVLDTGIVTHLGHVIAPAGRAAPGRKIMTVVVESEQVRRLENEVAYGTLDVISLEPGQMVTVTVQPRRGYDVGFGSGKEVKMTFPVGQVGLMIDARGRPLQLPYDDVARRTLIRQWLWDLGG